MKVSLLALTTPCAPNVMTPQVSTRQSSSRGFAPEASVTCSTGPGITRSVAHEPSSATSEPLASDAVVDPGKVTNFW
ncbi:hypothetical protein [Litorihabitans aurantiacus]|uniref:hypothetical protein n=1 Tax=Litorihabitans aurantiacus TaxID=1930061 RepID=UPI0024E0FB4A|nr:hypothetical protein [Litorihabitans aurantiacus]